MKVIESVEQLTGAVKGLYGARSFFDPMDVAMGLWNALLDAPEPAELELPGNEQQEDVFRMLWEDYGGAAPEELTPKAQELRGRLRGIVGIPALEAALGAFEYALQADSLQEQQRRTLEALPKLAIALAALRREGQEGEK